MKPADLRTAVATMTGGPWHVGNNPEFVLNASGALVAATCDSLNAIDNACGIVALRNHAKVLLDALQIADLFLSHNLTTERQHAVREAYRCARAKLNAIP